MSVPNFVTVDREAIFVALFALLQNAYAWKQAPSRRLKLWTDVPLDNRPAAYQFEGDDEEWSYPNSANPLVYLTANWFIYTNCKDPDVVGSTIMNATLKACSDALLPSPGTRDLTTGRQTLGGLVQWARIQGSVTRVPGDIDGDGMAIVPIRILATGGG